jgi:hypothetical protein
MPAFTTEPDLSAFTAQQIELAAAAWPLRAAEELRSALIYRALARAAETVLPAFAPKLAAVVHEELAHARLCAQVGERLGAARPAYDRAPVTERLAQLPTPRARTVALVTSEVAIGETISMAMFRESSRAATEPMTRAAIDAILADEARHQQLGWDALAALGPDRELESESVHALRSAEQKIAVPALRFLESGKVFDPAWAALGVVPPERRVEAFYAVVEQVVIPRLERMGIAAASAWAERYRR